MALARRVALAEMGVMTIGALLILTLALRAYQTGGVKLRFRKIHFAQNRAGMVHGRERGLAGTASVAA